MEKCSVVFCSIPQKRKRCKNLDKKKTWLYNKRKQRKGKPMKLLHCADLHLDARMQTHLPKAAARERRRELLGVFSRLAEYAESHSAALLMAGDIFDTATPSAVAKQFVKDVIRSHPTVRFLMLTGNHDGEGFSLFDGEDIPENLTLFGNCFEKVSFPDCDIYGYSGSEIPYNGLTPDKDRKNIVLLHGAVKKSGKPKAGEIVLSQLAERGIDYLALGHYHAYQSGPIDKRGVYVYAGCPEGRGFDECGERGFVLLDTEGEGICHRFIPFASRTLHALSLDITELPDMQAIQGAAEAAVAALPDTDMVKLTLCGYFEEGLIKDTDRLSEKLNARFFFAEVKDESRLLLRPEDYQNDISLKGEFIRRVLACGLSEELQSRMIAAGLSALRGEEPEV